MLAVPADLNSADGIRTVVVATAERFGGVDILVNNSGGPQRGKFADFTDADWREAFEVVTLNFVRFVREVRALHARPAVGPHRRDPVDVGEAAGAKASTCRTGSARASPG